MLLGCSWVSFLYFVISAEKLDLDPPSLLVAALKSPPRAEAAADPEADQADADQHGQADVDHLHQAPSPSSPQVEQHQP